MTVRLGLRGGWVRSRARALERITALLDLSTQIPCGARRATQILESIVVRLEILVRDTPVLDRHVLGQKGGAITLREVGLEHEIRRQEAPGLRIPVHPAAPDPVRRHERAP